MSPLYDILFTIDSGENEGEYGFILRKTEAGAKDIQVQEIGTPNVERLVTLDNASYQDFDPRYDTVFAMASFSGGLGQLEYEHGGVAGRGDPEGYWWGDGVLTHVDGKAFPVPRVLITELDNSAIVTGAIDKFYSFILDTGVRWDVLVHGRYLYVREAAQSNPTVDWALLYDAGSGNLITDIVPYAAGTSINGLLVASPNTSGTLDYRLISFPTNTWTLNGTSATFDDTVGKPKLFAYNAGTLFAAVDNAKLFLSGDGGNWAGPIEVTHGAGTGNNAGDGSHKFVGLKSVGSYVIAFKQNAAYSVTAEQDIEEVIWQWKDRPSLDNFKYQVVNGETIVFSVGPEVYSFDPLDGAIASFRVSQQDGFSVKEIHGLGADNGFVYIAATVEVPRIHDEDRYVILRAYRRGQGWAFENIVDYDLNVLIKVPLGFHVAPSGLSTRIYWSYNFSGAHLISYMDIPREWDESTKDVVQGATHGGFLYTSISRAGFPGFLKRHLWTGVEGEGLSFEDLSTYGKIDVAYSVDGGATFTALGTLQDAQTGRFDFNAVTGNSIVLRFLIEGKDNLGGVGVGGVSMPVLRVFDHHQRVRFRYLPLVIARVAVGDNVERNNGSKDPRRAAQVLADLRKIRTEDGLMLYEDVLGHSFECSVGQMAVAPVLQEVPDQKVEMESVIEIARSDSGD